MAERKKLANYTWIQVRIDNLDDPDFMRLPGETAGVYIKLYLMAGRADSGGLICNSHKIYSVSDIAFALRMDAAKFGEVLTELEAAGLMARDGEGWKVARFMDEQGPGEEPKRAEWRERQAKHRSEANQSKTKQSKENNNEENSSITHTIIECHRDVTVTNPAGGWDAAADSPSQKLVSDDMEEALEIYPEDVHTVLMAFCNHYRISPPLKTDKLTYHRWVDDLRKINEHLRGCDDETKAQIVVEVERCMSEEASRKITSPHSLVGLVAGRGGQMKRMEELKASWHV